MHFKIGDLVTRKSYNNDILFKIEAINNNVFILSGVDVRLCADAYKNDLILYNNYSNNDSVSLDNQYKELDLDNYFYIPGKILHIDADKDYLNRCLELYKKSKLKAYGVLISEEDMPNKIIEYVNKCNPDIVVITGHDSFNRKNNDQNNIINYKNSKYFIESIKKIRTINNYHDKLIIIAGACQSNYELLIKAGANFASSPKRVNIHAIDPAIIAISVAYSTNNEPIDIKNIISKTKYKELGFGGIITNGVMYRGYPR